MDIRFYAVTKEKTHTVEAVSGETILSALRRAGIVVEAPCGGNGTCSKCKVTVETENGREEVLSCQTPVQADSTVYVGDAGRMHVSEFGRKADFAFDGEEGLGAAIDIGTTTVVVHLYDLKSGQRLATESGANAQRPYGADVISRISYAEANGVDDLRAAICGQITGRITAACRKAGRRPAELRRIAIAGNTVMEHLFAGLDPTSIGVAPYKPLSLFDDGNFDDYKLAAFPDAEIYLAPSIAGYVGGDITAGLLACGTHDMRETCLFLDVGTNGEMALLHEGSYNCCATAAGPAFEGAEITCGMPGVPGAINTVTVEDGKLHSTVLGGGPATGVCGSGLIDALAAMLKLGAMDDTGRMDIDEAEDAALPYMGENEHGTVFFLNEARTVYITQNDIRQVQLAKAAVAAGLQVLVDDAGLPFEKVDKMFLAGGFGSFINKESAVAIGLLPKALLHRIDVVGNSAGEGACAALGSKAARDTLADIAARCRYTELSSSAAFMNAYVLEMGFDTED